MKARRAIAGGMLAAAPLLAACSLLFQLDGSGASPPSPDAATPPVDASADVADAGPQPGCPLLHWPDRPATDDPSRGDVDLTFAISSVRLGFTDAGPAPGFDLDGLCTCPDAPSCVGTGATPMCDRDGGVDNGGGDLLSGFSTFGKIVDEARANQYIAWGRTGLLFVLHDYNGQPNDSSVELALFLSDGTPKDDAGFNVVPQLDGGDTWTVNRASAVGGMGPPVLPVYLDPAAYVAGGTLVARFDFPLRLAGAVDITLKLEGGALVARVAKDGPLWRLEDGVVAGRWSTGDVLGALASFDDPFVDGGHLCGNSLTYQAVKPRICAQVDITANPAADRTGAKCNAFSMGVGFTAVQAVQGPLGPPSDASPPCGASYKDDCPSN